MHYTIVEKQEILKTTYCICQDLDIKHMHSFLQTSPSKVGEDGSDHQAFFNWSGPFQNMDTFTIHEFVFSTLKQIVKILQ